MPENSPIVSLLAFRLALALVAVASLTGCFGLLKPSKAVTRQFVLTSLPAAAAPAGNSNRIAVGVGQVKLPAYLLNSSLAVRSGTNEIDYLPWTTWAEPLRDGLQRTIAANLATLLPSDQIRLSEWRSDDVSVGLYVAFERFDVNVGGEAVLAAWWRVLSPGGERLLKSGETRLTRAGPPPATDPSGAVATMSDLVGEMSRQLARAVRDSTAESGAHGAH